MDPTAAVERFLAAMDDDDHEEARDAADALMFWLTQGGYPPKLTATHQRRLWAAISILAHKALAWERGEL